MKLQNATDINNKTLKLTIEYFEENTNKDKLNFTWNCTKFTHSQMELLLIFHNPTYLSYGGVDNLEIEIVDNLYFSRKEFG